MRTLACVLAALPLFAWAGTGPVIPLSVTLNDCNVVRATARQVFNYTGGSFQLATPRADGAILCITAASGAAGYATAAPCGTAAGQGFALSGDSIVSTLPGSPVLSVPAPVGGPYYQGIPVSVSSAPVSASTWTFNSTGLPAGAAVFVHAASGLCLDAGPIPNAHACLDPSQRYAASYCNASLSLASRVADLLGQLTLAEKIALTGSGNWSDNCDLNDAGVPRLFIPPFQWLVETNSGIASQCYGATCATTFASGHNLAASFNGTVWYNKGAVLSTEMRSLNNVAWARADTQYNTHIGLSGFGPDINQPRDPRNGRTGELAGEDPLLIGAYAVGMLQGMQQGEDPRYLKMAAACKHFAGYSLETDRFGSKGNFSLYDLWDTYLRPYEAAFTAGNATGSMCSYISLGINGGPPVPACANSYLLTTVVREYWGRPEAMHTSDCGAVANMANANHYVANLTMAAAVALNGGLDINTNTVLPDYLAAAIADGYTTEAALDAAITRSLTVRFKLGIFDPLEMQPYVQNYGPNLIGAPEHAAIAMDSVAQGLVLIKNDAAALPLTAGKSVAVVGPLAGAQYALAGDYYGDSLCPGGAPPSKGPYTCIPPINASIADANVGGSVLSFPGTTISSNDSSWGAALAAVASADQVVLVLGTDQSLAGEGTDLSSIALPAVQQAFAAAVYAAAGAKPVVLVIVSSFPVSFDAIAAAAAAIVLTYTPTFGSPAVAAALYGANRWGRAVLTHYPAAYQNAVALGDFSMVPGPFNPGRSYRYYNGSVGPATVTFGQGLTYSQIAVKCVSSGGGNSDVLSVSCLVTSTAGPSGDQILQVYHRVSGDIINRIGDTHPVPLRTLVGYDRVTVAAGASVPVTITLSVSQALSLIDATGSSVLYAGSHFLDVWDGSANNITLAVEVPGPLDTTIRTVPVPE